MSLQMYYDNTTITDHSLFGDHQNILDLDFQHGFMLAILAICMGLGYGRSTTRTTPVHGFPAA